MNELHILKYFILNKDTYITYNNYVNKDYLKEVYPDIYRMYLVLDTIYQDVNSVSLSLEDFKARFHNDYPGLNKAQQETYKALWEKMGEVSLQESTIKTLLETHRERAIASKMANMCWDVSQGRGRLLDVSGEFERLSRESPDVDDNRFTPVTSDLDAIYNQTYGQPGLKWRLITLRKMMGSLRKGDFGFIFGRPEVGKTTFLADMCSHFATQLDKPLLHISNEESGAKIMARYYQATLGLTVQQLIKNRKQNEQEFLRITKGNIKIIDYTTFTWRDVESLCKKHNPGIIIMDSIDKIGGFHDDRDDLMYKKIYSWARELSKAYAPVIGVCHASAGAEGKKYLEMDDVAYAKTAKQSEADWILGIGKAFNSGDEIKRYLHMPKNKLMGDPELMEELRHGKLEVLIHPEVAQFQDSLFREE